VSLADEVRAAAATARGPGSQCVVGTILRSLPESDAADLLEVMGDRTISATVIARVLADRDIRVNHQSIGRHRRGDCCCGTR
jgi:hypothetical protein